MLGIGLAILTPGIRSVAVPACGIAGIARSRFIGGLVLGSGLFLALHFAIGLLGGSLLNRMNVTVSPALLIVVALGLLGLGLAIWFVIRRCQRPQVSPGEIWQAAVGAWHEATCPVCLALGAKERLQIDLPHTHHDENHKGSTYAQSSV